MKFSFEWLSSISGYKGSAGKLAGVLSLHAFETELSETTQKFADIIVAKVTDITKHPNADRLRIVTLTDGKSTFTPVVCGAWNFEVGALVALALPGAVIPHNQHDAEGKSFILSKASIRGIESQGMICSGKELGLSGDGTGILLLDGRYHPGQTLEVGSDSKAEIFDISVPANRPDLVSYRGVAWEISALTGSKYQVKPPKIKFSNYPAKILKVRIAEPALCKKYTAVRLGNIKIGPSPKFIQDRLKASGLRPINNVVDITNYIMLEVGQPLHAFDASKIALPITVRKAYLNETIKTLDGVERKLSTDFLVIADSTKAQAVAGIIGGTESAVSESTSEIILEAANFNSVAIRRSSRALGLRTDSSSRFEKSLPAGLTAVAAAEACELLIRYASAKVLEYISIGASSEKSSVIKVDPKKINSLLGFSITDGEQIKILKKFGFMVRSKGKLLEVSAPFWRPDVRIWQDLAEEIARFKGLEHITALPVQFVSSSRLSDKKIALKDQVSDFLVGMGFDETYTYSFVAESVFEQGNVDRSTAVEIANPLSSDQKYLRTGIGMNYQQLVEQNSKFVDKQSMFEIGNVYRKKNASIEEHTNLFLMCFSKNDQPAGTLVGSLRELFQRLGVEITLTQNEESTAEILIQGMSLGHIRAGNGETKWAAAELNFDELVKLAQPKQFNPISRFPAKEIDVAIVVRKDLPWAGIRQLVSNSSKLIRSVNLFDIYQGKNISPEKKSLAFKVVYQAKDRTLTDEEINKIHSQTMKELTSKFNAQIRD